MSDTNEKERAASGSSRVFAIPDGARRQSGPGGRGSGVAFTNRDGSITLLLDALPLGTNKLQVREMREDGRPAGNGGAGAARLETVEVRP